MIPTAIDGVLYDSNGQELTLAEAEQLATADPGFLAYVAGLEAFDALHAATIAIRDWSTETQTWLATQGAQGSFDQAAFLALIQQAEAAGLAYNALAADQLTPALIQEQQGMALRGQQAQILYALSQAADGT